MNPLKNINWYNLYILGIKLGISSIKAGDIKIGLRSLLNPIRSGFNRYIEVPYAINSMKLEKSDHVLDIASPKHVALFIKLLFSNNITALDIMPDYMEDYKRYEKNIGLNGILWQDQDARRLKYKDASFDKVYSISVLEHIPDNGDTLVIREIGRVLKPCGICVITVPFSSTYQEVYKKNHVYERKFTGKPVFFSRFYNELTLSERLIIPSGMQEIDRTYYSIRFGLEALWDRLPRPLQMSLHWAGPLFAGLCYKKTENTKIKKGMNGFCCITLRK